MVIDYSEGVTLLTWGFFLDDNEDKIKINNILGDNLSEKISDFENEQAYLIIKRDAAESFINTINNTDKVYGNIKEFGKLLIESKNSSHTNSDLAIPISINDITELSKVTIKRRQENFKDDEIYKRMGSDMAELEKLSTQLRKMGGFSIPDQKLKKIVKIINENNLTSLDIELFNKLKKHSNHFQH